MHYTKYTDKDQEISRLENEVYSLKRQIKGLEKPVAGSDYGRIPCYDTPTVVEQEQAEEIESLTQKVKTLESRPVCIPDCDQMQRLVEKKKLLESRIAVLEKTVIALEAGI